MTVTTNRTGPSNGIGAVRLTGGEAATSALPAGLDSLDAFQQALALATGKPAGRPVQEDPARPPQRSADPFTTSEREDPRHRRGLRRAQARPRPAPPEPPVWAMAAAVPTLPSAPVTPADRPERSRPTSAPPAAPGTASRAGSAPGDPANGMPADGETPAAATGLPSTSLVAAAEGSATGSPTGTRATGAAGTPSDADATAGSALGDPRVPGAPEPAVPGALAGRAPTEGDQAGLPTQIPHAGSGPAAQVLTDHPGEGIGSVTVPGSPGPLANRLAATTVTPALFPAADPALPSAVSPAPPSAPSPALAPAQLAGVPPVPAGEQAATALDLAAADIAPSQGSPPSTTTLDTASPTVSPSVSPAEAPPTTDAPGTPPVVPADRTVAGHTGSGAGAGSEEGTLAGSTGSPATAGPTDDAGMPASEVAGPTASTEARTAGASSPAEGTPPAGAVPGTAGPAAPSAPAVGAASRPAPAPAHPADLSAQVVKHLSGLRTLSDGTHHTTLHLSPEHLGDLTVTVDVRGSTVQVSMAGEPTAIASLRDALGLLRDQLSEAGLDLGQVSLQDKGSHGSREGSPRQGEASSQAGSDGGGPGRSWERRGRGEQEQPTPGTAGQRGGQSTGRGIDLSL